MIKAAPGAAAIQAYQFNILHTGKTKKHDMAHDAVTLW